MKFEEMLNIARNVAVQQGGRPSFNDTICVARSMNGNIVVGVSYSTLMNGNSVFVHAEVDLCNKLMENMDTAVSEMSLFNAVNFQPVLPCNECIGKLINMNYFNAGTALILPDRTVPLSQVGMLTQNDPNTAMNAFPGSGQMGMGFSGMNPPTGQMRFNDQQSVAIDQLQAVKPVRNAGMGLSRAVSEYTADRDSDDSVFLKKRLNQLLDDDADEAEETEKKSKKKFKFFK